MTEGLKRRGLRRPLPFSRWTDGAGRSPGGTDSPDAAVMERDDLRHRHGGCSIAARPGDRRGRRVPLQLCEEPGCAGANLTGTKRDGAGALVCGSVVRLCVDCRAHGMPEAGAVRGGELRPVSQTGMIEALMMHRQCSSQKKFPFPVRNFRTSQSRARERIAPHCASTPKGGAVRGAVRKFCPPIHRFGAGVNPLVFGPRWTALRCQVWCDSAIGRCGMRSFTHKFSNVSESTAKHARSIDVVHRLSIIKADRYFDLCSIFRTHRVAPSRSRAIPCRIARTQCRKESWPPYGMTSPILASPSSVLAGRAGRHRSFRRSGRTGKSRAVCRGAHRPLHTAPHRQSGQPLTRRTGPVYSRLRKSL
ncbi:hypothetical protein SSPS47_02170 [Streptomyces sp. S4.7]|nr:hypothetical protein SSPS47_02170 [Streptomyces sp. S4.7]